MEDEYLPHDLVVCTKTGNGVHPNNFRRVLKVTVEQVGLPKIRLHDLRQNEAA